jgi:hypothetical protein
MFATDRGYRRKLFIAYAASIVFLGAGVWIGLPPFLRYLRACAILDFLPITEICALTFLAGFTVPAIFLISVGRKILFHKQVPYPGMKVIRDTKVIFGGKAIFRGRLLVGLGVFSIFISIAGSLATHYYFEKFRHFNPFHTVVRPAEKTVI